jgi:hypothetical protein
MKEEERLVMRNRSRPVLQLPRTPLETLLEALTVLGLIAVIAMTVWINHFNASIKMVCIGLTRHSDRFPGAGNMIEIAIHVFDH